MLPREYVVDLKPEFVVFLFHLTVLARIVGAPPNQTFEAKIHRDAERAGRTLVERSFLRAFDFISDNR